MNRKIQKKLFPKDIQIQKDTLIFFNYLKQKYIIHEQRIRKMKKNKFKLSLILCFSKLKNIYVGGLPRYLILYIFSFCRFNLIPESTYFLYKGNDNSKPISNYLNVTLNKLTLQNGENDLNLSFIRNLKEEYCNEEFKKLLLLSQFDLTSLYPSLNFNDLSKNKCILKIILFHIYNKLL